MKYMHQINKRNVTVPSASPGVKREYPICNNYSVCMYNTHEILDNKITNHVLATKTRSFILGEITHNNNNNIV